MAKMDCPLDDAMRRSVEHLAASALQQFCAGADAESPDRVQERPPTSSLFLRWKVLSDAESPDRVQERLYEAINAFRSKQVEAREVRLSTAAGLFGCLWGQTVCDRLGWEWAVVSLEPETQNLGVVSPSRSHVVFPVDYFQNLLTDPERDQTSLLLYNMLKAGRLPPASPGAYSVLG